MPAISGGSDSTLIVTRIIDGDTFVLSNGIHVRLIGLDTPEKGQPFYEEAKVFAESTVLGSPVRIEYGDEPYDNYDRSLVFLFEDTLFYNERVVRAGLASAYFFENNRKYSTNLISAQKTAREAHSGIWSMDPPPPEEYYVSIRGSFRFHRPLCLNLKKTSKEKLERLASRDEALDLGLSPCRRCQP